MSENNSLKSATEEKKTLIGSLESQVQSLQGQQEKLQENNDRLQKQYIQLQVTLTPAKCLVLFLNMRQ